MADEVDDQAAAAPADEPEVPDAPEVRHPPTEPAAAPAPVARSRRSRRVSKWDRPPHPRDWRFVVGTLGKVLLSAGILMFGFVAYQLWGTGLETARAQRGLEDEFEELLAAAGDPVTPSTSVPGTEPTTTEPTTEPTTTEPVDATTPTTEPTTAPAPDEPVRQDLPAFREGDPIAHLEIPDIGVDKYVVAGVSVADLRKGPGHFPETPMPGQLGNAAIAGHRTTYGQPFYDINELEPGDDIVVTTLAGRFVYVVTGTVIVRPSDYGDVVPTRDPDLATLTLISCEPRFSASKRIVVTSELDGERSDAVGLPTSYVDETGEESRDDGLAGEATATTVAAAAATTTPGASPDATTATTDGAPTTSTNGTATTVPAATDAPDEPVAESADAFTEGWFHDTAAFPQVALWGAALTIVSIGAWLVSRRVRHDSIGLLVGIAPFAIALFFFFQNVNRLLPPSL